MQDIFHFSLFTFSLLTFGRPLSRLGKDIKRAWLCSCCSIGSLFIHILRRVWRWWNR